MIVFPILFHPETMRWSTVLYSCLFCFNFIAFAKVLLHSDYGLDDFSNIIKILLYAYCIVLIIQQFCVLTGLPIFNVSNYSPFEPWKLNSLMSEPSHSARVIPILMFFFVTIQKLQNPNLTFIQSIKENVLVWLSFLWPILTMVSATAFIFLFIIIFKFVGVRRLIPTLVTLAIIGIVYITSENKSIVRAFKVVSATVTLNEQAIIQADHSASFRIVPSIKGAKAVDLTDKDGWFGHGVDADQKDITPLPSVKTGSAGAFYLWYDFGFIVALLFWIISLRFCIIKDSFVSFLIWLLVPFMGGGLNSQIIWFIFTLVLTYKFVRDGQLHANAINNNSSL